MGTLTCMAVMVCAQDQPTCAGTDLLTRAYCPVDGCHERYTNYQMVACDDTNGCELYIPVTICCGSFANYADGGPCNYTKFKDPQSRMGLEELASAGDFMIPDCQGALVPASVMLKQVQLADVARILRRPLSRVRIP